MKRPSLSKVMAYVAVILVTASATALVAALLLNVFERKQEAKNTYVKLVELTEDDVDPKKWGTNWPREYDGYNRTSEPTATKYGGGLIGPEGGLPREKAEANPWLTRLFAGYLFAVDYRDRRGHAFMLEDQMATKRNIPAEGKQSGNCLHCHASIMPLYRSLGKEALPEGSASDQIQKGLAAVGNMGYWDAYKLLEKTGVFPVSCVDCHDPNTMALRVTRPAFITGMQKLASSDAAVPHLPSIDVWRRGDRAKPYDPNTDGTRQEMRAYVCAQCHVEYYCGKGETIFFPWSQGLKVEEIEAGYDAIQVKGARFKDWTHAETGMEVLKAQHPEFELWSQGTHARNGVACADCHMPYKREGALKVSEHWVKSPLLQINRSCVACHPNGEAELKTLAENIQDRHFALLTRAGKASVDMLDAIASVRKMVETVNRPKALEEALDALSRAEGFDGLIPTEQNMKIDDDVKKRLQALWASGVKSNPDLVEIGELQRAAQWRLDFVAAENSMGFHAPQEAARILGEAIDLARQAQVKAIALGQKTAEK